MTLTELCNKIDLQKEVKITVQNFANNFDFSTINYIFKDFMIYEKMESSLTQLQNILKEDKDNIKILTCMLYGATKSYNFYKEKKIADKIFFDTMKCFTRFINESFSKNKKYYFDRSFWTTRQIGCHLFRIGELEYEIIPPKQADNLESETVIGLHIPSDCNFSPESVEQSIQQAKFFFQTHFSILGNPIYQCHSWLLDQQLKDMLKPNSNILSFQKRFEIFNKGNFNTEFIEWVFNTNTTDYSTLPEKTSLQKNIKNHILTGGKIYNSFGRLK